MSDLLQILGLALVSTFNPSLLAAVTVMLLLPNPKRLMLGYLLGAYTTSISVGMVVVFSIHDSGAVSTSRNAIGPAQDIVVGLLLVLVAVVLRSGREAEWRERRKQRKAAKRGDEPKPDPLPIRLLGRGSPRVAFAIGVVLSFPGASYLLALGHIDRLEAAVVPTALLVVGFCLMQQILLELPLLGYVFAPERTADAVRGFRSWLARNGRRAGANLAGILGLALVLRGLIFLLT